MNIEAKKNIIYLIRPQEADRTASLILPSFESRSRNASMLFRCGVMIEDRLKIEEKKITHI